MKRMIVTLIMTFLFCTAAFAAVHVDPADITTYKANFAECIIQDVNDTGQSDEVIYAYLISAINSAWDTYSQFPLYIYSESNQKVSYTTLSKGDERFKLDVVKFIAVQSKARFLRAIYTAMQDLDISNVLEPEWFMTAIQDGDGEVLYLLEVNPGDYNFRQLEEETLQLLQKVVHLGTDFHAVLQAASYRITIVTYVEKFDELVVNMLFTDGDGHVRGEAILTRDRIFGKFLA